METLTSYHEWRLPSPPQTNRLAELIRHINTCIPKEWADFEISYTVEIMLPDNLYPTKQDLENLNRIARMRGWDGGIAVIVSEDDGARLLLMAARVTVNPEKGLALLDEEWPAFLPKKP